MSIKLIGKAPPGFMELSVQQLKNSNLTPPPVRALFSWVDLDKFNLDDLMCVLSPIIAE